MLWTKYIYYMCTSLFGSPRSLFGNRPFSITPALRWWAIKFQRLLNNSMFIIWCWKNGVLKPLKIYLTIPTNTLISFSWPSRWCEKYTKSINKFLLTGFMDHCCGCVLNGGHLPACQQACLWNWLSTWWCLDTSNLCAQPSDLWGVGFPSRDQIRWLHFSTVVRFTLNRFSSWFISVYLDLFFLVVLLFFRLQ